MESLFSSSVICPYLNRLPFYITVEPTVFVQNFMSTKLFWNRCTEKDFPTNPPVIPYFHEQHTGLLIGHSFIHMSTGPPHPQKTATSSVLFFLNYLWPNYYLVLPLSQRFFSNPLKSWNVSISIRNNFIKSLYQTKTLPQARVIQHTH